jgi:hypothetical protein
MDGRRKGDLDLLLDLEVDGALEPAQRAELEAELEASPDLAQERQRLLRLQSLLEESRIPVRPDFRRCVMAALPTARWETRGLRAWRLPVALLVLLGGSAAALVSLGVAGSLPQASFFGAFSALFDLAVAALLTGAGLLSASWRGIGMAVGDVFSASLGLQVLFGAVVVGLNLLLVLLVRRPKRHAEKASGVARKRLGE